MLTVDINEQNERGKILTVDINVRFYTLMNLPFALINGHFNVDFNARVTHAHVNHGRGANIPPAKSRTAFQRPISSSESSGTSFVTGRVYTPLEVRIATTRTSPSLPGVTSTTLARGHLVGDVCSPLTQTMSPTFKFGVVWRHLLRF